MDFKKSLVRTFILQRDMNKTLTNDNRDLKKYYEEWWENPKDPRNLIFNQLNTLIESRLVMGDGKKALDVGSGKGKIILFLLKKGYKITSVEINENFVNILKEKYPNIKYMQDDFNQISFSDKYDIVTAIEFIQNLDYKMLASFINKISKITNLLYINISNRKSLHGFWTSFRGFQKPFVYTYSPKQLIILLQKEGFEISYKYGVGFLTPITLLSNFRIKLLPIWIVKFINTFADKIFPQYCHLYYMEAIKYNWR